MAHETEIILALKTRFGLTDDNLRMARERRLFATVPSDKFREVLEHVRNKMQFTILCTITGQDEGENLTFMYHMARMDGTMLNMKTAVPKADPVLKTITDIFPNAMIYERELVDLFGIKVEGLPPGKRYPLPDNWPEGQYPLRKDWKPEMLEKGRKEGEPWAM